MNAWRFLRIMLSLVTVALLYGFASEPPKTRAYIFNATPAQDKNAVFYKKIFSKEQMNQHFIYKMETTNERKAKKFKQAHPESPLYIHEEENGNRYFVIFSNHLQGEFAKISPEPRPPTS